MLQRVQVLQRQVAQVAALQAALLTHVSASLSTVSSQNVCSTLSASVGSVNTAATGRQAVMKSSASKTRPVDMLISLKRAREPQTSSVIPSTPVDAAWSARFKLKYHGNRKHFHEPAVSAPAHPAGASGITVDTNSGEIKRQRVAATIA